MRVCFKLGDGSPLIYGMTFGYLELRDEFQDLMKALMVECGVVQ